MVYKKDGCPSTIPIMQHGQQDKGWPCIYDTNQSGAQVKGMITYHTIQYVYKLNKCISIIPMLIYQANESGLLVGCPLSYQFRISI